VNVPKKPSNSEHWQIVPLGQFAKSHWDSLLSPITWWLISIPPEMTAYYLELM